MILHQLPFGLTVPIDGHGPGHFECPVCHPLTLLGRTPWRGRKDSGEGGRRTAPLLSLCISGWWWAVFPSCSISMWKGRAGSTGEPCLSAFQRTLLEGSVYASLPKPLLLSRLLVWASEPPPSLSYIGLGWLGGDD